MHRLYSFSLEPYKMGQPAQFGACGWTINSVSRPEGIVMAPFYPAVYPDNLDCYYKMEGKDGQRVRLEFTDFDIYHGGDQ